MKTKVREPWAKYYQNHTDRTSGAPIIQLSTKPQPFDGSDYHWISYGTGGERKEFHECSHVAITHYANKGQQGFPCERGVEVECGPELRYGYWAAKCSPMAEKQYIVANLCDRKVIQMVDDKTVKTVRQNCLEQLHMLPKTGKIMNIPQAIIEPSRDGARTLAQLNRLKNFLQKMKVPKKALGTLSLAEVAGYYLAYIFGIRPTMQDIQRFLLGKDGKPSDLSKLLALQSTPTKKKAGDTVRVAFGFPASKYIADQKISGHFKGYFDPIIGMLIPGSWPTNPGWKSRFEPHGNLASWVARALTPKDCERLRTVHAVREIKGVAFARLDRDVEFSTSWIEEINQSADPFSLGWELLPFSFVVDWFADIGSQIKKQNAFNRARKVGWYLERGTGLWLSERTTDTEYAFAPTVGWKLTGNAEFPSPTIHAYGYPINCGLLGGVEVSVHATLEPVQEYLSYGREKVDEVYSVMPLHTSSVADVLTDPFKASASLAMLAAGYKSPASKARDADRLRRHLSDSLGPGLQIGHIARTFGLR